MRKFIAVVLAGLFLILFFVAVTVNQVVDTATDPGVVIGMVNDADSYDYVYDNIFGNLVHDMVENGIEIDSGLEEGSPPTVLTFDDPDEAAESLLGLFETLVPREYVREKFEESLQGVVPYAKGETDEFTIDLEVQERVRSVPGAARKLVSDLNLSERVIDDLLVPQLDKFSAQISGQALGINFTDEEIEANARLIFAPEWLEAQLFSAIDEVTPYFAGDSDSFNVTLQFDDRIYVIGTILKDKLNTQQTLYNLVFTQVVDPLIQQTVAQSTSVGFGISLTELEVTNAFEIIAPRDWVTEQGDGVVDALIEYLVGDTDSLSYTVDLSDRKVAATTELQALARRKLETTLGDIPACTSPAEVIGAGQDLQQYQLPRCITGGQTMIDLAMSTYGTLMDDEVATFVGNQVPNEVAYSLADFESQVGGGIDTVDDVRRRVIEGVNFSDRDLVELMAGDDSPQSIADAEKTLKILANGVLFTEQNINDYLTPEGQQQLDDIRGYVNLGLSLRWLLWVLVLIPLAIIAFIGGRGWVGRLKWAGGVAVVCGLIVYGGIAVAWSFNDFAQGYIPDYGAEVSDEFMADYPRLGAELESDESIKRFERALNSWQKGWRNQTFPWIVLGAVAFAAGTVIPLVTAKRDGKAPTPTKSSSPSTGAGVTSSTRPSEAKIAAIFAEGAQTDDDAGDAGGLAGDAAPDAESAGGKLDEEDSPEPESREKDASTSESVESKSTDTESTETDSPEKDPPA